jgi:GNAT superfamily N-acetyltransferase
MMAGTLTIRLATPAARPELRRAIVELQEYERRLHETRLPGEQIADGYLNWMWQRTDSAGAVLVAEVGGALAGFVAGWVEEAANIAETPVSNRFGLCSDICVLPTFRGHRLAARLMDGIGQYLRRAGVSCLRVTSLAGNVSARLSYRHAGFSP